MLCVVLTVSVLFMRSVVSFKVIVFASGTIYFLVPIVMTCVGYDLVWTKKIRFGFRLRIEQTGACARRVHRTRSIGFVDVAASRQYRKSSRNRKESKEDLKRTGRYQGGHVQQQKADGKGEIGLVGLAAREKLQHVVGEIEIRINW